MQNGPLSALPAPGGGVPPGHVNETDRLTCQCPRTHTRREQAGSAEGGGWSGRDRNVVKQLLVAHWLSLQEHPPKLHASYPVAGRFLHEGFVVSSIGCFLAPIVIPVCIRRFIWIFNSEPHFCYVLVLREVIPADFTAVLI